MTRVRNTKSPCVKCGGMDRFPSGSCKVCTKASSARRAKEQPGRVREQANGRRKRWRRRLTPEAKREFDRKYNLRRALRVCGITMERYEAMLADQGGLCAICKGAPFGKGERLHIDHDHKSGKVRALLCGNCNTALGLLDDDPDTFSAAIEYLARHAALTITLAA